MALTSVTSQTNGVTATIVDGKIQMDNPGLFGPVANIYRATTQIDTGSTPPGNLSQYATAINATQYVDYDIGPYPRTITDNDSAELTTGTYYYYAEDGMNPDGWILTIATVDVVAGPAPNPAQLTAPVVTTAATDTTITPTWESVTNASSYKIRYGTANPPTGDGTTSISSTAITGLTESTTYYIQVKAIGDGTTYSDSEWSTVATQATTATPDTTVPVITLTGEASVTITVGTTWTDPGATATDNVDASVTVTTTGTVDTTTAGTYTITYNATDTAGNVAIPVTRTVIVNTAPTAIALAGATSNAKLQRRVLGQTEVYDLGALTVTDPDVGDTSTLAITAQILSGDDSPTPENLNYFALSGNNITAISTTPPGIYLVTVTATDSHGATYSQQFTITIASALIDPNDFVVTTLSATSVQAAFTIPTNTSNTAQIKWQRSTVDPDSANFNDANWVTIKTTDITGETVL